MKSIMERRFINAKKHTKEEREAAQCSVEFLKSKYEAARMFWLVIWKLNLVDPQKKWFKPFGFSYRADKLTQRHTFGKYDGNRPERGSWRIDPNSTCDCPAWFGKSVEVDKD